MCRKYKVARALAALSSVLLFGNPTQAANVVINEIYGSRGNAGAAYQNDFVELYNNSANAIDLSTYSLQYTSATGPRTGNSWITLNLSGSIGAALPTENIASGAIIFNLVASAGKLALVSSKSPLKMTNPKSDPSVVDFVGYGISANAI
jgi:hypothetical protein